MTTLSEILTELCEFHQAILLAYEGKESSVVLSTEARELLSSFEELLEEGLEEPLEKKLEEFLFSTLVPGPTGTGSPQQVLVRKKILINDFWKNQKITDVSDCKISLDGGKKIYSGSGRAGGNIIAASFGDGKGGQFGEFSSPLIDGETLEEVGFGLEDFPLDIPFVVATKKGFVEFPPLNLLGIKAVPITLREDSLDGEIRVNDGTFSSEIVANAQYERLVMEDCAFTPRFSKETRVKFDVKMFTSENIITTNRLQKTLKAIKKEAAVLKRYPNSPLSWNIVDDHNLENSLFSDKVGLFVTTTVGESIAEPPIVEREELITLIIDALWTMEQAIANKIYLTDLNIGNILYYDMKPIAELCGFPPFGVQTAREYSWDASQGDPQDPRQGGVLRVPNHYTRLVFVDLGTSFIEKPFFGNKKVVDLSPPVTRDSRLELQAACREDVISALMYCIVVNGSNPDLLGAIGNLNVGKNLFFQFLPHAEEVALPLGAPPGASLEVSEKYIAKVFR